MAREPKRLLTENAVGHLYESEAEIPWDEVERAVWGEDLSGTPRFSQEDRGEIFLCTEVYAGTLGEFSGGILEAELESARKEIVSVLENARDTLAKYSRRCTGAQEDKILNALHIVYGTKQLSIPNSLAQIGEHARCVAEILNSPLQDDDIEFDQPESNRRKPELVALESFIEHVLFDAKKIPAPSNPGYQDTPALYMFERWDIHIGPRSRAFRSFTNSLLGTTFTTDRIRNAFRAVRNRSDKTLEERVTKLTDGIKATSGGK